MRRWIWDVLVMASATGLSRLLGLARDAAIANRFGASAAYDAFLIAFFVPHFLRQLLAEGSLSTAFVPIYTERTVAHTDGERFAGNLLAWLLVLFPGVVAAGIWLAPFYVPFLASGFDPQKLELAVSLTQWVFPFIALVGFAAVFMGILNAHHRFFAASLAPVWFNVGMILGVLWVAPRWPGAPIYGLAVGVLLGGGGQLVFQWIGLRRLKLGIRLHLRPAHPALREMGRRMLPAVIAMAVAQINLLVDNKIASYLADGGISALQYAMRLFQLPIGIFAVSIATALLPRFSSSVARGEDRAFSRQLSDGLALSLLILLPAMTGLLILGQDVIRVLFEHGSFGPVETARTVRALGYYLVGLVPYGWIYVLTRGSYALGSTRLPVIASTCAVGVNVALDLLLVGPMQEGGLALATAIAGIVNAGMLGLFLRGRIEWNRERAWQLALAGLGTGAMAALVWILRRWVANEGWFALAVPTLAGLLFYGAFARGTRLWKLVRMIGGSARRSGGSEDD